jgi:Flp pilus assembly protein TadG
MMRNPKRLPKERGVAAVEFALIVPIFVATFGFIVSVGSGLWVRYQLVNHANAAARACAMSVPTTDASVVNCVPGVVQRDLAVAPVRWCAHVGAPVVSVGTQLSTNPNLHMLSVQLSCNMTWNVMNTQTDTSNPSIYTVTGVSQMPFLLPN